MQAANCTGHLSEPIVSLDGIDWQRPWLAPIRETGQALIRSGDWFQAANQIAPAQELKTASGREIVFVPQHHLPADIAYEAHIHASGQVPTRDNLHDFFNTLIWLHFPQIKKTLNALHAANALIASSSTGVDPVMSSGTRGRARDAATLFDENAAIFVCSDAKMADALGQHHWQVLLQQSPDEFFSKVAVVLFGHALMEKLVHPYKAITAHVWIRRVEPSWFALAEKQRQEDIDSSVAAAIGTGFSSRDFAHLPVLGVPGWWPEQTEAFYDDPFVFRSLRQTSKTS
jgi:Protein of unknown function (DUF3025)